MLIPILEWVVAGLMLLYFLAGAALIVTTDWDPKADLQQALAETNPDGSSRCPPSLCTPAVRYENECAIFSVHEREDPTRHSTLDTPQKD